MRIFAELLWLWKGLGISLLPSAVGVGLVGAVCRARKKPINKPAGYRAAVALANAQNYLKYISDNAAPKKRRRFFVSERRSPP